MAIFVMGVSNVYPICIYFCRYIAVTGTGYVYVKIITPDDEVLNAKASLEFPHHMMMTDIAFSSNYLFN